MMAEMKLDGRLVAKNPIFEIAVRSKMMINNEEVEITNDSWSKMGINIDTDDTDNTDESIELVNQANIVLTQKVDIDNNVAPDKESSKDPP